MRSATSTNLAKSKSSETELVPNDADIFRAAVGDIQPLPDSGRVAALPKRVPPIVRRRTTNPTAATADLLSDHLPHASESDDALGFQRPGVSPQTLRRLRRGYWRIQDELDLHGLTRDEARTRLVNFLNDCQNRDVKCIRIIHGKGLSSKDQAPVLKQLVPSWLAQRPDVLAFVPARPEAGGAGALIVLLKRSSLNKST